MFKIAQTNEFPLRYDVNTSLMPAGEILLIPLVLLALFGFWLLYRELRKSHPKGGGVGPLRMCPSCGCITPRSKRSCLECGKVLERAVT